MGHDVLIVLLFIMKKRRVLCLPKCLCPPLCARLVLALFVHLILKIVKRVSRCWWLLMFAPTGCMTLWHCLWLAGTPCALLIFSLLTVMHVEGEKMRVHAGNCRVNLILLTPLFLCT